MSQLQKKFIANNAVGAAKARLENNTNLRGRNAADSADVNILKVNASDQVEMASFFYTPATPPSADYQVANKKYVDDAVTASTPDAADVTYDNTTSGLTATNVQDAIDEVEGRVDTTESGIGHLQTLSGVAANADHLGTFTGTTIPDSSTVKGALQSLETAVELRALDSVVIKKNGSVAFTGDQSFGGFKATNLADPVGNQDAVTLSFLNARIAGIKPKSAVRVATTANGTLASAFENGDTVDGVTLSTGDRILIKDQTLPENNGIYTVNASGAPTRATDFDSLSPIDEINGAWVSVQEGTANAGKIYVQFGTVATLGTDAINFEYFNPIAGLIGGDMITFAGSTFSVDLATVSGLESSNPGNAAGQLRVKLEASNPSLQISGSNELGVKLNGAGAITKGASGIQANVDGSTIEIATNALQVKDAGITLAKLASNSVDENKIVSTAISTTGALDGGSGTKLSVKVDAATIKKNGSNLLEGLKTREEKITLSGTDITNQYVDLAKAIHGVDAANNSASLFAVGGPMQEKAVDYTVSLTGGSGGVTRITFAGDLATGGNAALIATDKLVIKYDYLT